jgi:hypothetical protein
VEETFLTLQEALPETLAEVDSHLERTYIGAPFGRDGARRRPVPLWNMRERGAQLRACANNSVEASHRRLQVAMRVRHTSIWLFMEELKKLLRCAEARHERLDTGTPADKQAPKYRSRAGSIANLLLHDYPPDDAGRLRFLKAIAHYHE